MTEDAGHPGKTRFLRDFLRLAGPFWLHGPQRWPARLWTAAMALLCGAQVALAIRLNLWSADLFDALARRTLDGVWLVGLTADGPAQRLTITARAIDAERVAPYLKQLNHETLLRDRRFQAMDIQEREVLPGTRIVEFQLSTSPITRRGS